MMPIKLENISSGDWHDIERIQREAYESKLLEDLSVLKQKADLPGQQCRVVTLESPGRKRKCVGYLLAHEFPNLMAPNLDRELDTDSYVSHGHNIFIHDFCLSLELKGLGRGKEIVEKFLTQLVEKGYRSVSLVAVQASEPFWSKFGFSPIAIEKPLDSYGDGAVFMQKNLS